MGALTMGLVGGGVSLLTSLAGAESGRQSQIAQASQLRAQAEADRQNAIREQERGQAEAYEIGRQKSKIRQEFQDLQSHNRVALGAGNVALDSGSAYEVSLGNIARFADDMGENEYRRALRLWDAGENAKTLRNQAALKDANASYMSKSAGNLGTSLLTAAISGATSFASIYSMAGGKLSSLFSNPSHGGIEVLSPGRAIYQNTGGPAWKLAKDIANTKI